MATLTDVYNQAVRDFQEIEREIAAYAVRGNLATTAQIREYDAAKSLMDAAQVRMDRNNQAELQTLLARANGEDS